MRNHRSNTAANFETLFGAREGEGLVTGLRLVARSRIRTEAQPRQSFPPEEIADLTRSIVSLRELGAGIEGTGILQPLLIALADNGDGYCLIAGERRFRAAVQAGLEEVPAIIVSFPKQGVLLAQLIENLQRQDLPPIEEARGIAQLRQNEGLSLRDVAKVLGKGKGYVEGRLDLLKMGKDVQKMVSARADTLRHARSIDPIEDQTLRAELISAALDGASEREIRRRIDGITEDTLQISAGNTPCNEELSARADSGFTFTPSRENEQEHRISVHRNPDTPDSNQRPDPLTQNLQPAAAFLAEATRQLEGSRLTAEYKRRLRQTIVSMKEQLTKLEQIAK